MAVDISKVFKANVKAIRMNQGDNAGEVLDQELLNKGKKKQGERTFVKETKNIVRHF
jgi:hypothetical protein